MDVAARMARLGTETAFEVLARAQALERQGGRSSTSRSASPTSTRPAHIRDAAKRGARRRRHPLRAVGRAPGAARGDRRARRARRAGINVAPDQVVVTPGAQADHVLRDHRAARARATRCIYPNPGLSDLRVGDQFRRRDAPVPSRCARRAASGSTSTSSSGASRRGRSSSSSTRRTTRPAACSSAAQLERDRRDRARAGHPRPDRRDLPRIPLRGRVRLDPGRAGHAGADDPARRLLEDLRDDRLAARLRRHAASARRARRAADDQLALVHRVVRPARRRRRAGAATQDERRRDGRGVPAPPRPASSRG